MELPEPIDSFFRADRGGDAEAFAAAFAPDAVVRDEGAEHRGRTAILDWWRAAKARYHHVAEPLAVRDALGRTVVDARVSGDFPGSPVVLAHAFRLAGDTIAELEIGG